MNKWKELKNKHQAEVNAFPIHFAFGQEQIDRKIKELGLSKDPKKRASQIVPIGAGGFVLKKDFQPLKEMFSRHAAERKAAIDADETGLGFIYDMFLYELKNHEYGYTGDETDTLEALDYTYEQVQKDPRLKAGLAAAIARINREEAS